MNMCRGRIGGIWVNQTKDDEDGARPQRRFMDVVREDTKIVDITEVDSEMEADEPLWWLLKETVRESFSH